MPMHRNPRSDSEGTPLLYNNKELAAKVVPVFQELLGKDNIRMDEPFMCECETAEAIQDGW